MTMSPRTKQFLARVGDHAVARSASIGAGPLSGNCGHGTALIISVAFDPKRTSAWSKSRTAAVSWRTMMCYRWGGSTGGRQRPASIQNYSDLAQGLADASEAG
jgi:hypothetical protein